MQARNAHFISAMVRLKDPWGDMLLVVKLIYLDGCRKIFVNLNYGKVDHQYPRNKKRFGKAATQRAWGGISIAWQKGGCIGG